MCEPTGNKCTICGAEGTNCSTCPFNYEHGNPNPRAKPTVHNALPLLSVARARAKPKPLPSAVPIIKIRAKPKPLALPEATVIKKVASRPKPLDVQGAMQGVEQNIEAMQVAQDGQAAESARIRARHAAEARTIAARTRFDRMPSYWADGIPPVSPSRQRGLRPVDTTPRTVIGSGTYGYVVRPGLPCADHTLSRERPVSKVMRLDRAMEEYMVYAGLDLDRIDPERKYSVGGPDLCELSRPWLEGLQQRDGTYRNVDYNMQTNKQIGPDAYTVLNYYDGGDTLTDILRTIRDANAFRDLIRSYCNLWEGLIVFHAHELCHLDIKPANVVGSPQNLRFIDFGISMRHANPPTCCVPYIFWPPEFGVARGTNLTLALYNGYIGNVTRDAYARRYDPYIPRASMLDEVYIAELNRAQYTLPWIAGVDIWGMGLLMTELYLAAHEVIGGEAAMLLGLIQITLRPGVRPSAAHMLDAYKKSLRAMSSTK